MTVSVPDTTSQSMRRLHAAVAAHGDRVAVVPASRLADLQRDIEVLKRDNVLNGFQQYLLDDVYRLDLPDVGFPVRSVMVVATPSPPARLVFSWRGRSISVMIPAGYVGNTTTPVRIGAYLNEALAPMGHRVQDTPPLPKKLLAARSGLGPYGRNNVCYVEGMGSLLNLFTYYSDVPCADAAWHELRPMEACHGCEVCLRACPTGAILRDRFLIDNTRCLTFLNEAGAEYPAFPEWVQPSAHHAAYGCARCTEVCPANRAYVGKVGAEVAFDEEETDLLLQGLAPEALPEKLQEKVHALDMGRYLGALPRNLGALGIVR